MNSGIVYTETVVWSAPAQYIADAPYQLVIVTLESGGRITARIDGARVAIGDAVEFVESRNGAAYYRKSA